MTMTPEMAEALEEAIRIWTKRAAGKDAFNECPLCREATGYGCGGCPVADDGHRGCNGTPFGQWLIAPVGTAREREAAQAEVDYLKSLREPKE